MIARDWFIGLGVPVFPIIHGTKRPNVKSSWFDYSGPAPQADLYGVPLGFFLVVDADSNRSLDWVMQHCPDTPFRVQTGPYHDGTHGRGVHRYYRAVPGFVYPRFIYRDGLTIELRWQGQYVMGPQSTHPSGLTYKPTDWSWDVNDVPCFPSDFVFDDGTRKTSLAGDAYVMPDEVNEGERAHELFRVVRSLKAQGDSFEGVKAFIQVFNEERCKPPKRFANFESWFRRAWHQPDRVQLTKHIDPLTPEEVRRLM